MPPAGQLVVVSRVHDCNSRSASKPREKMRAAGASQISEPATESVISVTCGRPTLADAALTTTSDTATTRPGRTTRESVAERRSD